MWLAEKSGAGELQLPAYSQILHTYILTTRTLRGQAENHNGRGGKSDQSTWENRAPALGCADEPRNFAEDRTLELSGNSVLVTPK